MSVRTVVAVTLMTLLGAGTLLAQAITPMELQDPKMQHLQQRHLQTLERFHFSSRAQRMRRRLFQTEMCKCCGEPASTLNLLICTIRMELRGWNLLFGPEKMADSIS